MVPALALVLFLSNPSPSVALAPAPAQAAATVADTQKKAADAWRRAQVDFDARRDESALVGSAPLFGTEDVARTPASRKEADRSARR